MFFTDYNFFKVTFVDPASPLMYGIIELHDHIFFFLNMILFLVLFLLLTTLNFFSYKKNSVLNRYLLSETTKAKYSWLRLSHGTTIEIIWTIVPSLVLILIAIPSFALLYATDEIIDPAVTVQVIGHQWYWSYEYNDLAMVVEPSAVSSLPKEYELVDFIQANTSKVFTISATAGKLYYSSPFYLELSRDLEFRFYSSMLLSPSILKKSSLSSLYNYKFFDTNNLLNTTSIKMHSFFPLEEFLKTSFMKANLSDVKLVSGTIEFDSYMRQETDLAMGEKRLYETDFPLVLPKNTHIRFMITADDVIHSWSVPALGIKVDAVPGRINHAHTFIKRSGTFYGQCSELCGVNHAFMPIQILVFEPSMYYDYLRLMLLNK